jgi:hypothetical protein
MIRDIVKNTSTNIKKVEQEKQQQAQQQAFINKLLSERQVKGNNNGK